MVKRPKSPVPVEDAKFLTVVHPFPMNANMEVPNDFKEFMFWLASIVGTEYALGVYHKPSARGMVVAEVSKTFQSFDKLLGEHSWNKFLHKVSSEERARKTSVYYSTYSTSRDLQKDGWKSILADDALFSEYSPINQKIRHPYPNPVWCDLPHEDPTNKRMCRPLPAEIKAPPPRVPAPVPGSSSWISQKEGKPPSTSPVTGQRGGPSQKTSPAANGGKGKPKNPTNPNAWKTPIISPQPSSTSSNSSTLSPGSAWSKPLSLSSSTSTAATTPRSISPASACAGTEASIPAGVTSPYAISRSLTSPPPGLSRPPGLSAALPPGLTRPTNPRGSSATAVLQHQFAATSIADDSSDANSIVANATEDGYSYAFSDGGDEDDGELQLPNASDLTSSPEIDVNPAHEPRMGKGRGKGKFSQGNVNIGTSSSQPYRTGSLPEDPKMTAPLQAGRTFQKQIEEDGLCPLHGVMCSKGICTIMKKRKREKEKLQKLAEKEMERAERRKGNGSKAAEEVVEEAEVEDGQEGDGDKGHGKDAEAEVGDADQAEGDNAWSVVSGRTKKSAAKSTTSSAVTARQGDWGPQKKRNAKQTDKGPKSVLSADVSIAAHPPSSHISYDDDDDDEELDTVTIGAASSARATYGGRSTVANSVVSSGDLNDDDEGDGEYSVVANNSYTPSSVSGPTSIRANVSAASSLMSYAASAAGSAPRSYSSGSTVKPTPAAKSIQPSYPSTSAFPPIKGSSAAATIASAPKGTAASGTTNGAWSTAGVKGKASGNAWAMPLSTQTKTPNAWGVKGK